LPLLKPSIKVMGTTGIHSVGISAGASTPDSVIAEIENALCPV
jgi:4-hydroxy-3-methylbut-2-enyl diphosphate reductase IspH